MKYYYYAELESAVIVDENSKFIPLPGENKQDAETTNNVRILSWSFTNKTNTRCIPDGIL